MEMEIQDLIITEGAWPVGFLMDGQGYIEIETHRMPQANLISLTDKLKKEGMTPEQGSNALNNRTLRLYVNDTNDTNGFVELRTRIAIGRAPWIDPPLIQAPKEGRDNARKYLDINSVSENRLARIKLELDRKSIHYDIWEKPGKSFLVVTGEKIVAIGRMQDGKPPAIEGGGDAKGPHEDAASKRVIGIHPSAAQITGNTAYVVGIAQDAGTKYEGVQHDAVSGGQVNANPSPVTPEQACECLREILGNAVNTAEKVRAELEDDKSGSTMTTAIVFPDGLIAHGTMGDSPAIALVYSRDGTFKKGKIINSLSNNNPYHTNILSEGVDNKSLNTLKNDTTGQFIKTLHVNDLISEQGDKVVILTATDGVLDRVGNAPNTMDFNGAIQYIENRNQETVQMYGYSLEAEMKLGGNPQRIAEAVIEKAREIANHLKLDGPDGRDNTSVAAAVVDPSNLPEKALVLMAADGFGPNGQKFSKAIKANFDQTLRPQAMVWKKPPSPQLPVAALEI
jgi:hypothetical protein